MNVTDETRERLRARLRAIAREATYAAQRDTCDVETLGSHIETLDEALVEAMQILNGGPL